MAFLNKIKQPIFWTNVAKIGIPFFIILVIMTLLWKSWSAVFSGDFDTISKTHFDNNKWKVFFGVKVIASTLYGLYVTNKKMK